MHTKWLTRWFRAARPASTEPVIPAQAKDKRQTDLNDVRDLTDKPRPVSDSSQSLPIAPRTDERPKRENTSTTAVGRDEKPPSPHTRNNSITLPVEEYMLSEREYLKTFGNNN